MSTNAVAYLLLTKFRDGATVEQLVAAMDGLRKDLDYNGRDLGFSGDSIDVINYAVSANKYGLFIFQTIAAVLVGRIARSGTRSERKSQQRGSHQTDRYFTQRHRTDVL